MTNENIIPPRPLPVIDYDNTYYWTGGEQGNLNIFQCSDCSYYIHPPVKFCPKCESRNVGPQIVSGFGYVKTFTINYKQWIKGLPEKYVLALVSLAEQEDVQLPCNIINCDPESVKFGMKVKVVFEQHEELFVPFFEPCGV